MKSEFELDTHFKWFLDKFGEPTTSTPVTNEALQKFKRRLPSRLLEYWQEYGFCGFMDGFFWIVDPDDYEDVLDAWIDDTFIVETDSFYVIGRNAFGDLYLWGEKTGYKYKISKNTLVLLSVGNCSIIKNHNLIFKSLSILPKNLDWIYLHVGAEDNNKSERKLAKQLNIYKKCKFIGAKYDFSNYGNISDIYIMPSLVEGLGIATIEAGAIGLIPILTRVPGNNDILKKVKGTIGINQTPKSLTQAILKIYIMKKKEKSKISFSIHQQMNLYWPEKNFYSWIKFYRSI